VLHVRLVRVATQRGAIAPLDPTRRKESTGWHLLLTRYKDPAVESARRLTLIALAVALAVLLSIFLSAQISPLEAPPAFFSGVALLVGGFWLWTAWRWWLTRRPSSRIAAALSPPAFRCSLRGPFRGPYARGCERHSDRRGAVRARPNDFGPYGSASSGEIAGALGRPTIVKAGTGAALRDAPPTARAPVPRRAPTRSTSLG